MTAKIFCLASCPRHAGSLTVKYRLTDHKRHELLPLGNDDDRDHLDKAPRQQIAAIHEISEHNDFAMLERIGCECAGTVSLLPKDAPPPTVGESRVRELSEKKHEKATTGRPDD